MRYISLETYHSYCQNGILWPHRHVFLKENDSLVQNQPHTPQFHHPPLWSSGVGEVEVMLSIGVWNVLTPRSTFQFLRMELWCINHHPISLQFNQCQYQWVTYKMLEVWFHCDFCDVWFFLSDSPWWFFGHRPCFSTVDQIRATEAWKESPVAH